jgi:hypothetical protein
MDVHFLGLGLVLVRVRVRVAVTIMEDDRHQDGARRA